MCNCQLFLEIAADLRKLHKEGYCHGDIRVSNLILGGSVGKIIDFDFAGKAEKDTYPPNLQTLVDGDRHEDVKNAIKKGDIGDLPLQFDHDWYSLKQAMHCFEAKESVNQGAWQNLIDQIDEEEVSTPSFFTVVLKKEKQNYPSKTGTPPKNQPTSTGGDAT
jgi:serine/threonine protein kinase